MSNWQWRFCPLFWHSWKTRTLFWKCLVLHQQCLLYQLDSGIIIWFSESVYFVERLKMSLTKKQSSVSWTHLYAVIRRLERRAKYSCQSPSGVHLPSQYFIMTAFLENISGKFLAHHHAALVIKLGKSLTQNSRKFPGTFHYRNASRRVWQAPCLSPLDFWNIECHWIFFQFQTRKKFRFRNKLDFLLSSNLIFTACVACKNQFRNQIDFLIF